MITAQVGIREEKIEPTNFKQDLKTAIKREHGCDNNSCDIREARENGFIFVSAYLLQGATETYLLDKVIEHYNGLPTQDDGWPKDWDNWVEHVDKYGIQCNHCNAMNFETDYGTPEKCGNCLEELVDNS